MMHSTLDKIERAHDASLFTAAGFDQAESERIGVSNYSYWRSTLRTFFKSKLVIALVALMAAILLMSFLYPVISRVDPTKVSTKSRNWNLRPSLEHLFGTDTLGRDISPWRGTAAGIRFCWRSASRFPTSASA